VQERWGLWIPGLRGRETAQELPGPQRCQPQAGSTELATRSTPPRVSAPLKYLYFFYITFQAETFSVSKFSL